MNKNLGELLSKLASNSELLEQFSAQKSLDDLYKLSISIVGGYSIEEFKDFLDDVVKIYSEDDGVEEISSDSLELVAGGLDTLSSKKLKTILLSSAMLVLGGNYAQGLSTNDFNNSYSSVSINKNENAKSNRTSSKKMNNSKNNNSKNASSYSKNNFYKASNDNSCVENDSASNDNTDNNENNDNSQVQTEASILVFPKASAITYGQSLSNSSLSGGQADVPGSFEWADSAIKPTAGEHTFAVRFIPTDNNLKPKEIKVKINVNKAVPKINQKPEARSITYGNVLDKSTLVNGVSGINGSFVWKNGNECPNAGLQYKDVIFVPNDNENYEKVTLRVPVHVKKASVSVESKPRASAITFGEPLSASRISNLKVSVPGTFEWSSSDTKLSAGVHTCSVVFRPFSSNYEPKTINVQVTVNKATPRLEKSNFTTQYKLGRIVGDLSLPKGWRWQNPYMRLDNPGRFEATAIYDETANYVYRSQTVSIEISKVDPVVPSCDVVYNANFHLRDIRLPAGWHWLNADEVPKVSKRFYKASFDAYDAGTPYYNGKSSVDIQVTVHQAVPRVSSWAQPVSTVIFGTDLSSVSLSGGIAEVPGTFRFVNTYEHLRVGTHMCKVIFTPFDSNYASVEGSVPVQISKNMTPLDAPFVNEYAVIRTDISVDFNKLDPNGELEFSKDGGVTWQSSPLFSNLSTNSKYYFNVRYKETDSRCAGHSSAPICIFTKASAPAAPAAPVLSSCTRHTIVMEANDKLEFSIDDGKTWQSSPVFYNLQRKTDYFVTARLKETDNSMPSLQSKALQVTTKRFPRPISWILG